MAMKNFINIFIFVFLISFLITPVHSQLRISYKFMGGVSTISVGDLNEAIKESHSLFYDYNEIPGCSAGLDLNEMNWSTNLKGEIIFHFAQKYGIGIGAEYLSKTNKGQGWIDYNYKTDYLWGTESTTSTENHINSYLLKATPVIFNLYYFNPLRNNMIVFLNLGAGYYIGSLSFTDDYNGNLEIRDESSNDFNSLYKFSYDGIISDKVTASALGFHIGAGVEIKIISKISLVAEVIGRGVNLKNWEGDSSMNWSWEESHWVESQGTSFDSGSERRSETGKMWYYDFTDSSTGGTYKAIGVKTYKPSESSREAEIGLSGFSFRIGIKITI